MKCTAIVLAAGQGRRMNSAIQKQFLLLRGKPILYYSLKCFQKSEEIEKIVLVTGKESIEYCKKEIIETYGFSKVSSIVSGGSERYESVYQGLLACEGSDYVFIHDGARPFVTEEIIRRGKETVLAYKACVIGVPSKDTVKLADEQGMIADTPKRSLVWNIQTPQVFSYSEIRAAHEMGQKYGLEEITDDAMLMERYGNRKIKLVMGSYENIKITTPEDIFQAEKILENFINRY